MPSGTGCRRGRERCVHHQVADVAHQQQAAAGQGQRLAVGRGVGAVGVEAAGHRPRRPSRRSRSACPSSGPASCGRRRPCPRRSTAATESSQIDDGGDGGFQYHVGDARRVGLADVVAGCRSGSQCAVRCAPAGWRGAPTGRRDSRRTAQDRRVPPASSRRRGRSAARRCPARCRRRCQS